ncbi:unnamed protein product [Meganyctiphanes norvegica]|uniref:C2H2-type domain-containing protein n=1 Tax=Meganyctiphanes norvegica TaxID=48144 RepID=A0AAV2S9X2_MEGNR
MSNQPQELAWSEIKHLHLQVRDKPFKCTECDSWFTTKAARKIHSKIHNVAQRFARSSRSYKTQDYNDLRKYNFDKCYMKAPVPINNLPCLTLDTQPNTLPCLTLDTPPKTLRCHACDFKCHSTSKLKSHVFNTHIFSCQECEFQCLTPREYMLHMASNHPKQKYIDPKQYGEKLFCKECDFQCFNGGEIRLHVAKAHSKNVSRELPKGVPFVKKGIFGVPSLKKDIKQRQTDKLFDPIPIGNHFDPGNEKISDRDETLMHKCPMCRYEGTYYGFKRHMKMHAQYYYKKTLNKDNTQIEDSYDKNAEFMARTLSMNHTNEKFVCTKCKSQFLTSARLKLHMKSHQSETFYEPEALILDSNEDYSEINSDADNDPLGTIENDNTETHPDRRIKSSILRKLLDGNYNESTGKYEESDISYKTSPTIIDKRKCIEDMNTNKGLDFSHENTPTGVTKKQCITKSFRCFRIENNDIHAHVNTGKVHRNMIAIQRVNEDKKFCCFCKDCDIKIREKYYHMNSKDTKDAKSDKTDNIQSLTTQTQLKDLVFIKKGHTIVKPFACKECGIVYLSQDLLNTHNSRKHVDDIKIHENTEKINGNLKEIEHVNDDKKAFCGVYYGIKFPEINNHKNSKDVNDVEFDETEKCPHNDYTGTVKTIGNHNRNHISTKPFALKECDLSSVSQMLANTHSSCLHGNKALTCPGCYLEFI